MSEVKMEVSVRNLPETTGQTKECIITWVSPPIGENLTKITDKIASFMLAHPPTDWVISCEAAKEGEKYIYKYIANKV